ncbi:hypothetical protein CLOM_g955, partial [Closterium sp. NIES-68]
LPLSDDHDRHGVHSARDSLLPVAFHRVALTTTATASSALRASASLLRFRPLCVPLSRARSLPEPPVSSLPSSIRYPPARALPVDPRALSAGLLSLTATGGAAAGGTWVELSCSARSCRSGTDALDAMTGARQPNNSPAYASASASASAAASAPVSAFPSAAASKVPKSSATGPPASASAPPAFDPAAAPRAPALALAPAPAPAPASSALPGSSPSAAAASAGGVPTSAASPAALAALVARREKLEEQVANAERQLFDLETTYLHDSSQTGSVLRGFDSLLAAPRAASSMKRPRKFLAEDRLFSLSSCTSSAAEDQAAGRDTDGRPEYPALVSSRSRSSGTPGNGPTPRRGRGAAQREGKRLRQQVEQEEEEEECVL